MIKTADKQFPDWILYGREEVNKEIFGSVDRL